jgi:hypothetical protein
MFNETSLLMTVTIGPLLGGRTYEVSVKTDDSPSEGDGSATIQEDSPTVISATGTTADGVGIEATVTCPSVTEM